MCLFFLIKDEYLKLSIKFRTTTDMIFKLTYGYNQLCIKFQMVSFLKKMSFVSFGGVVFFESDC